MHSNAVAARGKLAEIYAAKIIEAGIDVAAINADRDRLAAEVGLSVRVVASHQQQFYCLHASSRSIS